VHIDAAFCNGKRVLVIDDIYTTGQSSKAFIGAVEAAGATVIGAMFLAKTKLYRNLIRT
jgi:adenine/guanine phosphoribosyltransferase-like PRPP-binding protein